MASTLGNLALWLSFLFSVLQFIVSTKNTNSIIVLCGGNIDLDKLKQLF